MTALVIAGGAVLPEYSEIRAKQPILEVLQVPILARDVSMQAIPSGLGVDAVIGLRYYLVPAEADGIDWSLGEARTHSLPQPCEIL